MVDRDVNCRPLDWKYDNFPVQEMALDPKEFGPISLEESDSWLLQPQRLCEANLLDKLVTTSQNKAAHFYKQQLKT